MPSVVPICLSIAGSDSGGGAGIHADLKAFARCGVHGATAITAITAQNTVAVRSVTAVPPEVIEAQVHAIAEDMVIAAVKIGMLGDRVTIAAVVRALDTLPPGTPVVVDPVMVAESGARLLSEDAHAALLADILPRATVLTPNIPEARVLAGDAHSDADGEALAAAVLALGPTAVVLTGGHRTEAVDIYLDIEGHTARIRGPRHPDGAAHGSGCTHSSALAAHLALGATPLAAARAARLIAAEAVLHGRRGVGAGAGPVDALHLPYSRWR